MNAPSVRSSRRLDSWHFPCTKGLAAGAKTPLESWSCLFTDEILEIILLHTNEQIEGDIKNCEEADTTLQSYHCKTDLVEFKAFIGLLYYSDAQKVAKLD